MLLRWLANAVGRLERVDPLVATCAWSGNEFAKGILLGPSFFSEEDAAQLHSLGMLHFRSYITLSSQHLELKVALYRVKPKFHMCYHIVLSLGSGPGAKLSRRNPHLDATWLDEDLVGKVMRVLQKVHIKTLPLRTLQRYQLQLPRFFR